MAAEPYYAQLAAHLEAGVHEGLYGPGERLPSESELCTRFDLSRATVRQTLQTLEARGVVQRIAGRGAFVAPGGMVQGWMIQGRQGFLETALGHGHLDVTTRVLHSGRAILSEMICGLLEIPEGSEGFELVRVRALRGIPALYSINYSPPDVIGVLEQGDAVLQGRSSLSALLGESGYALQGAHRSIVAVSAPRNIASRLDVRTGSPLLRVRSVSWRRDGKRFDVYEAWVRSDLIPLEVDVSAI
ncbi:transcriptional regulator [Asaia krungthepensis NRIC 0535]|uniref:Transcriptional regulator n=2 Tax=Asaia krungthepensis TaxID=220990 RepID=A0ABQ0PZF4_9PROT|nr:transcriptional regulator [Asaia krungthepensis NRIC 0535]